MNFSQDLPDVIRLGARFAARPDVELRLFGDYTRWSAFKHQCIYIGRELRRERERIRLSELGRAPEPAAQWNDGFGLRGGGSFWVKPEVEVFAGVGFDSNVVPAATLEPALTDYNTVSAALGGRFKIGEHLYASLAYTHFFFISRDTAGQNQLYSGYAIPIERPRLRRHVHAMDRRRERQLDVQF